ncbi:MAG: zinc ribbon domain-containing protein [Desulfomonile tiedjei]|nr:zinc ribbon domain-containing protein [Desulfomonile tiedjei]
MPIFEFKCDHCGNDFEKLVFASEDQAVKCPKCGSEKTHKILSVFSSSGSERCSGASCGPRPASGHS